jgi:predicted DNA-binding transcriptional regulator YafY
MANNDMALPAWDELEDDSSAPRQESAERLLRLVLLLTGSMCTRKAVFTHLGIHYKIGDSTEKGFANSRRKAERQFERDLAFLEEIGYEIEKTESSEDRRILCYQLVPGSGPGTQFLFQQAEIEALIVIYALFTDPSRYTEASSMRSLPTQPPRHPFSEDVLTLIERFVLMLPEAQRLLFDEAARKPYIYFNIAPVTDYLPYRALIHTIVNAIGRQQSISFLYSSSRGKKNPILHQRVDPYYVIHLDGHFYLIGYSYKTQNFYEYRVDRILEESLKTGSDPIDSTRQQKPIEFRYWADEDLAHSGLSQRWLSQSIEREEEYTDEHHHSRHRFLIRAYAYSDWRILQQLRKYGSKVELVEPQKLRGQMHEELQQTLRHYQ